MKYKGYRKLIIMALVIFILIPISKVQASALGKNVETKNFNYVYINEEVIEEGESQSIVVSWNDIGIENLELILENEENEKIILQAIRNEEGIFLFQQSFQNGIYAVQGMKMKLANGEEEITAEELGIQAYFGVGKTCEEKRKTEHIEMESIVAKESEEIDAHTASVEMGSGIEEREVENTLRNARMNTSATRSKDSHNENVVIFLDPGHDASHAGASANGVKEEEATLKIAQYCKEELEKYEGVEVYLTRGEECPYPETIGKRQGNILDIKERVKDAANHNADAFVSLHLNSSVAAVKGAEVYYHKSNTEGKNLAQDVQNELVKIGLYNRGAKPDKSYSAIVTSQSYGFPGIIVEHAFVTNSSDVTNYLKTDEGLKKLGVADAAGIAKAFGLIKREGEWIEYAPNRYGDVRKDTVLRVSSKADAEILETVEKGERVLLYGYDKYKESSWYKVLYGEKTGYISADDVKLSYQKYNPYKIGKTTANMYMRSGVGLNYRKKSYIKSESEITLLGYYRTEGYDWYYIEYEGVKGYVSSKYVKRIEEQKEWVQYDPDRYGDVRKDTVLRVSSKADAEILETVEKGERVLLYGYDKYKESSWYKVLYGEKTGYISADDVKLSYQKYNPYKIGKTTANMYMRSGVGLNYRKKSYIKSESEITLLGYYRTEGYDWYYIEYEGVKGYVSSKYVNRESQ